MKASEEDVIVLTREDLYERVWTTAMRHLGPELGVSDVGLKKICKRFNIPTPPVGYWAKREHGKASRRPKLAEYDAQNLEGIKFYPHSKSNANTANAEPESGFDEDVARILSKAQQLPPIKVLDRLTHPHPLVRSTISSFEAYANGQHDHLNCYRLTLNVAVSKAMFRRAMCIMHAIIERVEQLEGKVEVVDQKWKGKTTMVTIAGEQVAQLRLREKYNQVRVTQDISKRYSYRNVDYVHNGMLVLDSGASHRSLIYCKDTAKKYRLENGLDAMIIGFVKEAGYIRVRRRHEEEVRINREIKERELRRLEELRQKQRDELQIRQKNEQDRVNELRQYAMAWRESQNIRAYLKAIKEMAIAQKEGFRMTNELTEFLHWAEQQADRLDPLRPSPSSVLDETIQAESR